MEKLIKDKIKIQYKKERQDEDDEREELNKVIGTEKNDKKDDGTENVDGENADNAEKKVIDEEEKLLYTLNPKQLKICEKIIDLFEGN